jgi:hypothetical protein
VPRKKNKEKAENDVRIQGIEPWSVPWEGTMIPLHQMRLTILHTLKFYLSDIFGFQKAQFTDGKVGQLRSVIDWILETNRPQML